MGDLNVRTQYATDENLSTRINLHEKYSVNKQGFGSWIFEQYRFEPGMRILELGCGNGSMWAGNIDRLPKGCELILSDFSPGMLAAARENIGEPAGLVYRQIDIMEIPYEDHSMDAVIANMMLYHVPDIARALAQVRRVLKPGSMFYCATYGENSIMRWLRDVFAVQHLHISMNTAFTLQNGEAILLGCFDCVARLDYPDAFEITNENDLADYILSLTAMADLSRLPKEEILSTLAAQKTDGVIRIPKEYGMFISR